MCFLQLWSNVSQNFKAYVSELIDARYYNNSTHCYVVGTSHVRQMYLKTLSKRI